MAASNLIDQDFGSESEDDSFNPAPAVESDNENGDGASEDEGPVTKKTDETEAPARRVQEEDYDEDEHVAANKQPEKERQNGHINGVDEGGDGEEDADGDGDDYDLGTSTARISGGEDDEDEDNDDDEDDDEEEEISGHRRKRARRDRRNQFLDVEAEVDEDEDEAEEDDDELQPDGFIADTHPDDINVLPAGGETDDRGHRELDRRRELEASLDAEKQAAALKERYGRNRATTSDSVVVPKRLLLPSVQDPSIWATRCKPGKEKEVVFGIMKRVEERAHTRAPLSITSAFERGSTAMAGLIFVEARRSEDILTALDGLSNVFPRTMMKLIAIKEMPDLLRVMKTPGLEPGKWVRLKRGKYAGDLAQVDEVEQNGLEVTLRVVPRLDYGLNEDANAPMIDNGVRGEAQKRKRQGALGLNNPASKPPKRLFSEVEAKKKHLKYLQQVSTLDKRHWTYLGDTYVNGFLIKDFKIQHLQTEDVNPILEEVTPFTGSVEDGTENLDLATLSASLKASTSNNNYLPGDMVEVYTGEQQGVCGRTVSVQGDIVTMTVTEGELRTQTIEVPVKGLRKRFKEGDHVKVIGGSRFRDEVGMVVRIVDDKVTVLNDSGEQEIVVFSKDLREASDSGVPGGVGKYDLYDLVQIDAATVGCITKVDRESLRILDQNASVRTFLPSQISNKLERRKNAVATDRDGSELRVEDTVRETRGEGKQGTIIHIFRSFLFIQTREQTENSGISVLRTTNVITVAAKGGRVTGGVNGPDLTKMNPAMQRNGAANGGGAMAPPKSFGRDRALGQTVTIRKGPYKGLLGVVKDTTDNDARVELHTKSKTITVPKDTLEFKDKLTGQSINIDRFGGGRGRGDDGRVGYGGATPSRVPNDWQGSRTPMGGGGLGSRTPAWGASSRTPAWSGDGGSGGRTPAWKQDSFGGRTPAYGANDGARTVNPYADGSRTAYGGGGKTPAWNPGARTPYGDSGFSSDAWQSGSKTPSYTGGGSKTPAYSSNDSWGHTNTATTNNHNTSNPADSWGRAYDPPTPGAAGLSAPTPGALSAPTPGALDAPTPGGYSAPTPAGSGPTPRPPPSWGGGGAGGWENAPTPAANAPTPGASHGGGGGNKGGWGGMDDEPRYSTPSP
ncbi:MAG: transcription elongation factor spt5 [Pycnora praestabilis]|nr:MAG: transcription elongation factor spt5 [Pycnora praestabilis]